MNTLRPQIFSMAHRTINRNKRRQKSHLSKCCIFSQMAEAKVVLKIAYYNNKRTTKNEECDSRRNKKWISNKSINPRQSDYVLLDRISSCVCVCVCCLAVNANMCAPNKISYKARQSSFSKLFVFWVHSLSHVNKTPKIYHKPINIHNSNCMDFNWFALFNKLTHPPLHFAHRITNAIGASLLAFH